MPIDTASSVTILVRGIRAGHDSLVAPLWALYFERLTRHASKYLTARAQNYDEDAALSALNVFCIGLANGKFDYVDKREVLWGTLATITERKARKHLKDPQFWKEVPLDWMPAGEGGTSMFSVVEPIDAYKDCVRIELNDLIDGPLPNPLWRQAVRMVMEGYSAPEIAARLERTRECVYVWFRTIRAIWEEKDRRENPLA